MWNILGPSISNLKKNSWPSVGNWTRAFIEPCMPIGHLKYYISLCRVYSHRGHSWSFFSVPLCNFLSVLLFCLFLSRFPSIYLPLSVSILFYVLSLSLLYSMPCCLSFSLSVFQHFLRSFLPLSVSFWSFLIRLCAFLFAAEQVFFFCPFVSFICPFYRFLSFSVCPFMSFYV